MPSNPDFKDLFKKFNEHRVEYLACDFYPLFHAPIRCCLDPLIVIVLSHVEIESFKGAVPFSQGNKEVVVGADPHYSGPAGHIYLSHRGVGGAAVCVYIILEHPPRCELLFPAF